MKEAVAAVVRASTTINIGLMQFDTGLQKSDINPADGIDVGGVVGNVSDSTTITATLSNIGGEGGAVVYPVIDVNAGRQDFFLTA